MKEQQQFISRLSEALPAYKKEVRFLKTALELGLFNLLIEPVTDKSESAYVSIGRGCSKGEISPKKVSFVQMFTENAGYSEEVALRVFQWCTTAIENTYWRSLQSDIANGWRGCHLYSLVIVLDTTKDFSAITEFLLHGSGYRISHIRVAIMDGHGNLISDYARPDIAASILQGYPVQKTTMIDIDKVYNAICVFLQTPPAEDADAIGLDSFSNYLLPCPLVNTTIVLATDFAELNDKRNPFCPENSSEHFRSLKALRDHPEFSRAEKIALDLSINNEIEASLCWGALEFVSEKVELPNGFSIPVQRGQIIPNSQKALREAMRDIGWRHFGDDWGKAYYCPGGEYNPPKYACNKPWQLPETIFARENTEMLHTPFLSTELPQSIIPSSW